MKRNKKINRKLELGEDKKYDESVDVLAIKFTPELGKKIGELFIELQLDKKNMNVETYMSAMKNIFMILNQRNKNIGRKEEAFINEQDIFAFIKRYPRIISQDVIENLYEKLNVIESLSTMDARKVNTLIKKSKGYISSIGIEKNYQICIFLDNLNVVKQSGEKQNAAEYLLLVLGEKNLQISTRKVFSRLMHICSIGNTNEIDSANFNFCLKRNDNEYKKKYGISQDDLYVKYVVPITQDRDEYKIKIKERIDNIINPQSIDEVENHEK